MSRSSIRASGRSSVQRRRRPTRPRCGARSRPKHARWLSWAGCSWVVLYRKHAGLPRPPTAHEGASHVALSLGIVGLPNVGKSTLFTALTRKEADAANYPFATIEPNVGLVEVPDARIGALAEIVEPAAGAAGRRGVRRHRRSGEGCERGRGARQPVPGQHPRDRRHLRGRAVLLGPQRHPRRGPREPRERRRDDPHRTRARRPRHDRARAARGSRRKPSATRRSSSRSRSPSAWPRG